MEKLSDIVFYNIDKAIRSYRMYAQKKLRENGFQITIDQWLVIKAILENPGMPQQELAGIVFKDNASITRIIDLLVKAGYLDRSVDTNDRRRSVLKVNKKGVQVIKDVQVLVLKNRAVALEGISPEALEATNNFMKTVIKNCK